jgi:hypothetical protein
MQGGLGGVVDASKGLGLCHVPKERKNGEKRKAERRKEGRKRCGADSRATGDKDVTCVEKRKM